MLPVIYTIGHSTHPADYFLELLSSHGVNCLVDVRSMPASRFNPQFNKKALQAFLEKYGIAYLHFGEEFGARKSDPELLDETGHLDFEKVRASKEFRSGIERLKKGVEKGFSIALMCAEADPLSCHRFSMISVALKKEFDVRHILKDKTVMAQEEMETELVKKYAKKLRKRPPMLDGTNQLELAFRLNNLDVAYSPGDERLKK